jgi:lipoyl(octanoyl) transferase
VTDLSVRRLGRVRYADGLALQSQLVRERQEGVIPDTLLLLEHEPVFTLGQNAKRENVLVSPDALRAQGFDVEDTGRGGDVTYHGPGQIVAYPILQLAAEQRDVHRYLRDLEEAMIRTCASFGVVAGRADKLTGAWVADRKIGAIGVRVARWVTSHGLALNVNTDLSAFNLIIPCGLHGRPVTSMARELGRPLPLPDVMSYLTHHLASVLVRTVVV